MTIWFILWPLEIIYDYLVYFVVIFPRFGILDLVKSGNPAYHPIFFVKVIFQIKRSTETKTLFFLWLSGAYRIILTTCEQGCHIIYIFSNPKSQFWRALEWNSLVYSLAIWDIFRPFGIYFGHLEYISAIWNIFWPLGIYFGHSEYISAIW
jgi:hypothetical protein